ncbi:hypothetical protein Lal_00030970 [Lupinus albus]|uniref:Putative WRC domain-containing protein n=1 Tax=Lupinus albus TaxID=3870 RepID=A0A6A4P9D7_LUPAL|nr:putative WRC domain-containing protein [Lupinus albus]KAF1863853.1 hypothetical protein Lal_00030970 [Lupinus albus]
MRIRKNSKLSPLLFSFSSSSEGGASFPVQTHLCQLNQSPWDVIPFHSDSNQFEGDDSFSAGNGAGAGGSAGDSIGVVESVASMAKLADMVMGDENHKREKMEIDDISEKGVSKSPCCEGFDAKGWSCKNEPKHGQSFCRHHLSIVRSDKKAAETAAVAAASAAGRGSRARAGKKTSSSSSNPYEFYYYSGFGPLWGKRRGSERKGERKGEGSKINNNAAAIDSTTMMMECENIIEETPNSDDNTTMDNNEEELDFVNDNDEEEDDANEDDNGKKRMRKPVKARSLKSLM